MKNLLFIICLTMLLKPVLPVLDYILNYEYIAGELCVNRETTIIGCDGKCYLVKELAKASDSEKPLSTDKKHVLNDHSDLFFSNFPYSDLQSVVASEAKNKTFNYSDSYTNQETFDIFRPPTFIS